MGSTPSPSHTWTSRSGSSAASSCGSISSTSLEFDLLNSFHVHANFFDYYPTGTRLEPRDFTDTVIQGQGERGILELRFPYTGKYMFHAHVSEFAELGWMGFFEVVG